MIKHKDRTKEDEYYWNGDKIIASKTIFKIYNKSILTLADSVKVIKSIEQSLLQNEKLQF